MSFKSRGSGRSRRAERKAAPVKVSFSVWVPEGVEVEEVRRVMQEQFEGSIVRHVGREERPPFEVGRFVNGERR